MKDFKIQDKKIGLHILLNAYETRRRLVTFCLDGSVQDLDESILYSYELEKIDLEKNIRKIEGEIYLITI